MKADLLDHRKFLRLQRLLAEPIPHVLGYLMLMWKRGYQTGTPILGDELDVEAAAGFMGEPSKFANAALAAGFLDREPSGELSIHDLYDHAPEYARKRIYRKGNAPNSKNTQDDSDSGQMSGETEKPRTDVPENGEKAADRRTEVKGKRREVRGKSIEEEDSPEVAEQPREQTTQIDIVVMTFPTVGTGPQTWDLTQRHIDEWTPAFPSIDVLAECRKAHAWVNANQKKTANGMAKFLVNWLSRATNYAKPPPSSGFKTRAQQRNESFVEMGTACFGSMLPPDNQQPVPQLPGAK